ncbi:hypothetical protein [Sorangium sp. So ce117]|uniref:hypothetical protein n=1 Tax=Sorangium sp. So ce117 TaxID=3133277 RepID=UPI003F614834
MLHDPDSYDHLESTEPVARGRYWVVRTRHHARNGFGAVIRTVRTFDIQQQTVVKVERACIRRHGWDPAVGSRSRLEFAVVKCIIPPMWVAWVHWGVTNVLLPLAPFGLSLLFRGLADPSSPPSQPILWNSELPFFTLVMGLTAVQKYFLLRSHASLKVREVLSVVVVGSGIVAGLSLLLLALYYLDQHVQRIPATTQTIVQWVQFAFAWVQLFLGAGMRYAETSVVTAQGESHDS